MTPHDEGARVKERLQMAAEFEKAKPIHLPTNTNAADALAYIENLEAERDSCAHEYGVLKYANREIKARLARLEREREEAIKGWAGVPPDSYPQWWFVPDEAGSDTLTPNPKRPATLILHDTTDEEEGAGDGIEDGVE